jgi:hypothetical protein
VGDGKAIDEGGDVLAPKSSCLQYERSLRSTKARSEQDTHRRLGGTALPEQTGGEMEIDLRTLGESLRRVPAVAGSEELPEAPGDYVLRLHLEKIAGSSVRHAFS